MSEALDELRRKWTGIDVYLLDLLLRGELEPPARVLDAGCGKGRNAQALAHAGFDVTAVDRDEAVVAALNDLSGGAGGPRERRSVRRRDHDSGFLSAQVADLAQLPFEDGWFDVVVCNAVLHFAEDESQFRLWLDQLFRVLRQGGLFFARLSSTHGVESVLEVAADRRARMPNGMVWFLVDQDFVEEERRRLGADPVGTFKTVVVHGQRAMSTWVLRKA